MEKIQVIYEDEKIMIVSKPEKMLSHATKKSSLPDVLSVIKHRNYHVITRLDTNTEGLLLIAKDASSAALLNILSQKKSITKKYMAVCIGYLNKPVDTIEAYLLKDSENSVVRLSSTEIPDAQKIITSYKVMKEKNLLSLVEIELVTGKTHQIRAHFAHIGHPLLGDSLYGNPKFNKKHQAFTQMLVSYKLTFQNIDPLHPFYYLNDKIIELNNHPIFHFLEKR